MLQLNRRFLADIGLGRLAPGPASVVLANLATELEARVAARITATGPWDDDPDAHPEDHREIVWEELIRLRRECAIQIALVDRALPGLPRAYRWSNN